jgi:hypothetical protein
MSVRTFTSGAGSRPLESCERWTRHVVVRTRKSCATLPAMSVVSVLFGVIGLCGLFLVLAMAMTLAARGTARLMGVPDFRWFDARPATATWWRRLVVRLASMVAPLVVSIGLFWGSMLVGGVPLPDGSSRVDVLEGPARAAGIRTGDRIVSIGRDPVADFEQLRAAVKRHTGPTPIEVERAGEQVTLSVTPHAGRIGVQPMMLNQRLGAVEIARRAVSAPFSVVGAAAKELLREAKGADKPALSGPVGIVRETSKARQESGVAFFLLLAVLAGYLWPFAAAIVLFDVVTGYIFRAAHVDAADSAPRGYRLERLRQAALFAFTGYVTFLLACALDTADIPFSRVLLMLAMVTGAGGYPLIWIGGRELWGKTTAALLMLGSTFVPCLLPFAVLLLHYRLGRALKGEAFSVTWLTAQAPLRPTDEQTRWAR